MAKISSPVVRMQFHDSDGFTPLANGRVFTYLTGTTTPAATYSNRSGLATNPNPIVLDARGMREIFVDPGIVYDFVAKRPIGDDTVVDTWVGVSASADEDAIDFVDFGGVGDNVTDNSAAFAAAEASSAERVYLPEGTYYTTSGASTLTKYYHGPGKIRTSGGDRLPGRFTWISARPNAGTGTGYNKFFSADLKSMDGAYTVCSANRTTLTESYYAPETGMGLSVYDNRSGHSGTSCLLAATASTGATTITVNSSAGITNGMQIGFNDGNDNITDIVTVSGTTATTITFSPALANTYTYSASVPTRVTVGKRTMQAQRHLELQHRAGGDGYIHLLRVEASYTPFAGQSHVFFGSTAGFDGGDIVASQDGLYLTGREISFDDAGRDVAAAGDVRSYIRNNNTAAKEAFWIHDLALTGGADPIDAVWCFGGQSRIGLDLARGDFSSNGDCAIGLKAGHRIFFDNTGSTSKLIEVYGSVLGQRSAGYDSALGAWTYKNGAKTVIAFYNDGRVNGDDLTGKYTPTLNNTTNVAASTAFECRWFRIGNFVSVSGQVVIDPTGAGTTILGLSLPVATNMTAGRELSGVAASDEVAGLSARVFPDVTNDRAQIVFTAVDTASRSWGFLFTYEVLA